jgi:hypothetical protein
LVRAEQADLQTDPELHTREELAGLRYPDRAVVAAAAVRALARRETMEAV